MAPPPSLLNFVFVFWLFVWNSFLCCLLFWLILLVLPPQHSSLQTDLNPYLKPELHLLIVAFSRLSYKSKGITLFSYIGGSVLGFFKRFWIFGSVQLPFETDQRIWPPEEPWKICGNFFLFFVNLYKVRFINKIVKAQIWLQI